MDRGRHQNAFSVFPRQGEDRAVHMGSGALVQETVISTARNDMDLLLTDHIMQLICINSRRINDNLCL